MLSQKTPVARQVRLTRKHITVKESNNMKVEVSGFRFVKTSDTLIEVFDITDDEFPSSYIRCRSGDIDTEKLFQIEVMDWVSKNIK